MEIEGKQIFSPFYSGMLILTQIGPNRTDSARSVSKKTGRPIQFSSSLTAAESGESGVATTDPDTNRPLRTVTANIHNLGFDR